NAQTKVLILQLLCQIFSNRQTCNIFYSNDLNVLVDIVLRELNDLPDEEEQLRQAYLMVLLPMLKHSQYKEPRRPHRLSDLELTLVQLLRHLLKSTDPILPSPSVNTNGKGGRVPLAAPVNNSTAKKSPGALRRTMSIKRAIPGWSSRINVAGSEGTRGAGDSSEQNVIEEKSNNAHATLVLPCGDLSARQGQTDRRITRKLVEKALKRCREIKTRPHPQRSPKLAIPLALPR
ncbi:pre-rRNA processing, partial [Spiromyces aspiralis]